MPGSISKPSADLGAASVQLPNADSFRNSTLALFGILSNEESAIEEAVQECGLSDRFFFPPLHHGNRGLLPSVDILTFPNPELLRRTPGAAAAKHAAAQFDPRRNAAAIEQRYDDLLANRLVDGVRNETRVPEAEPVRR